jgi:hypothetical protein
MMAATYNSWTEAFGQSTNLEKKLETQKCDKLLIQQWCEPLGFELVEVDEQAKKEAAEISSDDWEQYDG